MASNNIETKDEDTTDTVDSITKILKYGDSDLSSKRRKNDDDDHKPKISDNNYESFQKMAFDTDLNSTFLMSMSNVSNLNETNSINLQKKTDKNDVINSSELSFISAKKHNNSNFITNSPSGTSCGFENTFRILQKQIKINHKKRLYLRRISEEYIPSLSSLMHDDNITDISCCSNNDITENASSISASASTSYYNSIESGTDSLDFFELELEAMQRLKLKNNNLTKISNNSLTLRTTNNDNNIDDNDDNNSNESGANSILNNTITSPINELLYGIKPIGLDETQTTNNDDTVLKEKYEKILESEEECNYPEYFYHISRGKDGRKYLKVVKSLLLDQVLCGNRVSQMTRAYDDIEAVTRLLEEKEKDLELTVQIGKELLTQNNRLENRISELETELKSANEDRQQLLHDLHQKNELIVILTNDVDDGVENETPTLSKSITLDLLQKKIQSLQDENKSLKQETSQLVKQTDEVEEQERKLMENIAVQLNTAHSQFDGLNLELERLKEENRLQHEQIVSLTSRLSEAEIRLHQLTNENDEQGSLLSITKENQSMLATELTEFKTRYQEVLALLQEAQEQLRKYRKKTQPHARSSFLSGLGGPHPDSLHSELMESSLYSENSLDSGISTDRMSGLVGIGGALGATISMPPYRKVFETVQCASKSGNFTDGMSHLGAMTLSSSSQPRMTAMPYIPPGAGSISSLQYRPSSMYSAGSFLGAKTMSCESLASQNSEDSYPTNQTGVPGVPGAKDLEAALKRLTPAEVLARRAMLSHAPLGTYSYEENYNSMPLGIRTPDSIMSTGSSGISNTSSSHPWRLPEKLQIVKPIEGSQTLHQWSRLATPNLSGLLEERPGVTTRGGRGLEELGMQVYSLSDVEEDVEDHPCKQFQSSACVYTFTNSTVMHPDDGTQSLAFLSQSQLSSRMASASTSRQPSCPPTPRAGLSRRNSCSTFSVNMGLASMLSERGIKAVTPSALNTPLGPNFSPTVTPCNSPEGSPTRSMSPEPLFGILSSGADLIRRRLIGNPEPSVSVRQQQQNRQQKIMLSRLEKRALRSLKLLEKVENIGLENIIATQPSAVSQLASGIASRSASPMAQLTSLKNLHALNNQQTASGGNLDDDIQFYHSHTINIFSSDLSDDSGTSSLSSLNSNMSSNINNEQQQQQQQQEHQQNNNAQTSDTSAQNSISNVDAMSDIRFKQMQRQKSRRNLKNGMGGQRPDLGTVNGRIRPDLGIVEKNSNNKLIKQLQPTTTTTATNDQTLSSTTSLDKTVTQTMTQSFVGSISSLFFGRKGGWM